MKVEVLYVAECPSHPAAVRLVKEVLAAEGVAAEIQEVLVRDEGMADELRFSGSPTIRINGRDVAGESQKAQGFCAELPFASGIDRDRPSACRGDSPSSAGSAARGPTVSGAM